jgi:hypothetical protein
MDIINNQERQCGGEIVNRRLQGLVRDSIAILLASKRRPAHLLLTDLLAYTPYARRVLYELACKPTTPSLFTCKPATVIPRVDDSPATPLVTRAASPLATAAVLADGNLRIVATRQDSSIRSKSRWPVVNRAFTLNVESLT